jgi:RimJ/RimL family protein N-acetyltransferase
MRRYVEEALARQASGAAIPFATTEAATGRVIGSTRFHNVEPAHRRVEIGYTWIAPPWTRTPVNTEAKYLMLRHAFESLGCVRVELRTDALNTRSRAAILRIGAKEEGTLRRHLRTDSGRFRDTVYFSILDDEWPDVKRRLEGRLARPWPAPDA